MWPESIHCTARSVVEWAKCLWTRMAEKAQRHFSLAAVPTAACSAIWNFHYAVLESHYFCSGYQSIKLKEQLLKHFKRTVKFVAIPQSGHILCPWAKHSTLGYPFPPGLWFPRPRWLLSCGQIMGWTGLRWWQSSVALFFALVKQIKGQVLDLHSVNSVDQWSHYLFYFNPNTHTHTKLLKWP